jgi:putative effector of murein hydrolase LrgA (UPF0299 family)
VKQVWFALAMCVVAGSFTHTALGAMVAGGLVGWLLLPRR